MKWSKTFLILFSHDKRILFYFFSFFFNTSSDESGNFTPRRGVFTPDGVGFTLRRIILPPKATILYQEWVGSHPEWVVIIPDRWFYTQMGWFYTQMGCMHVAHPQEIIYTQKEQVCIHSHMAASNAKRLDLQPEGLGRPQKTWFTSRKEVFRPEKNIFENRNSLPKQFFFKLDFFQT